MPSNPDPRFTKRDIQAGNEIYEAVCGSLKTDRGVHLETAIAAVGYLTGSAILKNSGVDLTMMSPGAPVFVDQVNEAGPQVVRYFLDLVARGQQRGAESLIAPPAPSIPPDHVPLRSCEDLLQVLLPIAEGILTRHSIPQDWAPYVCSGAAARLIIEGQTHLAPSIAKAIVIESMVRASKTVPPKPSSTTSEISSRDDFFRVLAQTTAEIDGFAAREPAYGVWLGLQQQLHAMQEWSANNAQPTLEQLQRVSIGLIAVRELEPAPNDAMQDLITRLHQLNYYWRHWPTVPIPPAHPKPRGNNKLPLILVLAIALCLAVVAVASFALRVKAPYGLPISPSIRTPAYIATLISTMEPYMLSLHHDSSNDRYRIALFLYPIDGNSAGRTIPIAEGFRPSELPFGAHLLGNDGNNLWFFVKDIGALNLRTEELISSSDLRDRNPSLANLPGVDNSNDPLIAPEVRRKEPPSDLFSDDPRRYAFHERLYVTGPNFRQTFEVDPATLKATPMQAPRTPRSEDRPEHFLTAGGLLSTTEWIGVHSPAEAARDFKPGSNQSPYNTVKQSKELRRIYMGRVEQDPAGLKFNLRIASLDQVPGTGEYLNAALVCTGREASPMVLSNPDGFLITYTSNPGLQGTLVVARFDKGGKLEWTVDTGIGTLQQILPDNRSIAFIGLRPQVEGKASEPILVIIDTGSGRVSTSTLWK